MNPLSNYERETIINFNEGEDTASIYTHNRWLLRKLAKLAQERPKECRLGVAKFTHEGRAAEYYIPKGWIRVYPPRQISDEQRAAIAERLNAANPRRKTTCVQGVQEHEAAGEGNYTTQQSDGAEL